MLSPIVGPVVWELSQPLVSVQGCQLGSGVGSFPTFQKLDVFYQARLREIEKKTEREKKFSWWVGAGQTWGLMGKGEFASEARWDVERKERE